MFKKIIALSFTFIVFVLSILSVSAVELPDETKKCTLTLTCSKPDCTYTIYKVGVLDTTNKDSENRRYIVDESILNVSSKFSETIEDKDIRNFITSLDDEFSEMPKNTKVLGRFDSNNSPSTVFFNLEHGLYFIKATEVPDGYVCTSSFGVALPYYNDGEWKYSSGFDDFAGYIIEEPKNVQHFDFKFILAWIIVFLGIAIVVSSCIITPMISICQRNKNKRNDLYDEYP